jgi:hypothetical protein
VETLSFHLPFLLDFFSAKSAVIDTVFSGSTSKYARCMYPLKKLRDYHALFGLDNLSTLTWN